MSEVFASPTEDPPSPNEDQGGGVLDHPSNEHQYFPPPPHHSRALNERLPSQPPARLYVRPSRQQLPPWIQLQLCNNMFWHLGDGGGVIIGDSLAISRQSNCRQLSHFAICRQSKYRQSINRLSTFLPPRKHLMHLLNIQVNPNVSSTGILNIWSSSGWVAE